MAEKMFPIGTVPDPNSNALDLFRQYYYNFSPDEIVVIRDVYCNGSTSSACMDTVKKLSDERNQEALEKTATYTVIGLAAAAGLAITAEGAAACLGSQACTAFFVMTDTALTLQACADGDVVSCVSLKGAGKGAAGVKTNKAKAALSSGYREFQSSAGAAANTTGGLPNGYRRVIAPNGNIEILAPNGKIYESIELVPVGNRPPNLSPVGAGRSGAFNQAKRDSGIPTSQQPSRIGPNFDLGGKLQPGRVYEYDIPKPGGGTKKIIIRDDAKGHIFLDNPSQNRGPHFNTPNKGHYDY